MLAHHLPSGSHSDSDRQHQRAEVAEERQLEKLIAAGLVGSDARLRPKKKRNVEFNASVSEIAPRENYQASRGPKVDHSSVPKYPEWRNTSLERRPSERSNLDRLSSVARLKEHRNSMLAAKGRESRRERTFIGSECAACEEPLEHTLRGERILQLSCGHVSHEACFYEYIKEFEAQNCPTCNAPLGLDPSRGAGIDFENLNKLVRSVQTPDPRDRYRDTQATPTPSSWESESYRQPTQANHHAHNTRQRQTQRITRDHLLPDHVRHSEHRFPERYESVHRGNSHGRNTSADTGATGMISTTDYAETHHPRRKDYDIQSIETSRSGSRHTAKNPIPAPTVTVRSEFPTLSKSRQQQSLTCLVTVEVVDGKWQPDPDDLRSPVSLSSQAPIPEEPHPPKSSRSMDSHRPVDSVHESTEHRERMESVKEELFKRVDNWHGLDYMRFGRLILYGTMRVGKDRQSWQELECYLFSEMLICVKEKKVPANASQQWDDADGMKSKGRATLKGSILIKRHLKQVEFIQELDTLTLSLSVAELPQFHLRFSDRGQLEHWRRALVNFDRLDLPEAQVTDSEQDTSGTDEDEYPSHSSRTRRASSIQSSSYGANRSQVTAPTEYTNSRIGAQDMRLGTSSIHVPLDIVVVVPVSSSMQGLKINLLRDALRFLVSSMGDQDRLGLVTFGSGAGGVPLVGMTNKSWHGWSRVLESVRPVGQKSMRADVVEGANVAMDLLMQRKSSNPLSSILLISDSATSDPDSVDFVVSRAEAAKITIHSFGLGLTHKPDTMVELSTRTKAFYTYVKDWMMLRECLAGCLGSLQTTSHQNVKLKLRLPEGSPAKFVKISGALQITKRATGRDAEASLGDLRFGDKRDILVQLAIAPDTSTPDTMPADPWENIISGLEALGGPLEQDDMRALSVEELPLIQADLSWGDILRDGNLAQLPRPSLLAITMLPSIRKPNRPPSPPIPPHPHIVQRRMELLTSDMLSRALTLVSRAQHDRAHHLLAETRSILKGLGKGGLPPLPPPPNSALPPTPHIGTAKGSPTDSSPHNRAHPSHDPRRTPSPPRSDATQNPFTPQAGIDTNTMAALDNELDSSLEWIAHPAVFGRDSRKAVLQSIGVISSQRAVTFRSPAESLWAARIPGVRRLAERSREWREAGDESLAEEA